MSGTLLATALLTAVLLTGAQSDPPQMNQHGLSVGTQTVALSVQPGPAVCRSLRDCDGVYVEFNAWVERLPADFAESVIGGYAISSREASRFVIERNVRDNFRKVYISYAVTIELLPHAGSYRVSFSNSNVPAPDDVTKSKREVWKVVAPPQYPLPQLFEEGDELPLALTGSATGVQLVDYIHIGSIGKMPKRTEAARDSYAEDSEFALARPSLRVNGEALPAVTFPESLRGEVLWLYVPGQGRYILSFLPHAKLGFSKSGEVAGDMMTLVVGGNVLRIRSGDRIAPGGGVYNVYGTLDPRWKPADPADRGRFMAGTSPAVETALPRR